MQLVEAKQFTTNFDQLPSPPKAQVEGSGLELGNFTTDPRRRKDLRLWGLRLFKEKSKYFGNRSRNDQHTMRWMGYPTFELPQFAIFSGPTGNSASRWASPSRPWRTSR
jgi:hypothetical protein